MSILVKSPGGRAVFKKKLVAVAAALTLSGTAALVPFAAVADHTTAHTIEQLTAQIAALQTQLLALQAQTGVPSSGAACSFTRDLTVGVRGDDVTCLQDYLTGTGHFTFSGGSTGFFGPITRSAVAAWQAANGVSPAAGYFGPISRAEYSSVVVAAPAPAPTPTPTPTTPTPTTPGAPPAAPVGSGLTVAAAANQPEAQLAPLGATRFPFTRVVFTAAADGDVTVKSVTVERQGAADDDAFDNLSILDEDGAQIGLTKTLNSSHQAVFNEAIVVKAGTSRTITLAGKMLDSAPSTSNAGQVARIALVAVDAGTSTVNGSLPISGNGMTINESLTIGSVTMARGSFDPGAAQTKEVGVAAYTFSSIKVTAGSAEKVFLKNIRWNQSGSAGSGDLGNLKTLVDGTEYAVTTSSDGKYFTTVFPENTGKGILIDKGFSKDVSIKGDIIGGSARTIAFDLAKRTDVGVTGDTYGLGITPPQTNTCGATTGTACFTSAEDPWYDGAVVTISAGTMTVSTSNTAPAQNIAINVSNQPLGAFTVDVKGETISVAKLGFNVTLGSEGASADVNDITNVTLVDESGAVVAGPVDGNASDTTDTAGSGDGVIVFSSTVNFPVGIRTYKLLGKIGTDITNNVTILASTTPSSDFATVRGLVTGNTITPSPAAAISFNTMTVKAGALTVSVSSVPIAQTIIAGSKAFTFANYIFNSTASGEDVRVVNIPLEYNNPAGGTANRLSNCQLFDGANSVSTGGNVVNPSTIGSSTSFTFDGNGLILTKGTSKTLTLKCDIGGGATGGYQWGLANNASTFTGATGVTSGQTITETLTASAGQIMTSASGGTITAALDAGSPGYTVVNSGQTNMELVRIRFTAANEDIDMKQVALQLTRVASNTPVDLVGRKVTLWDYTASPNKQIGEAVFPTDDFATSSLIASGDFRIPRDGSRILSVRGDIAAITASGPLTASGDWLTVNFDGDNVGLNGTYGTGVSSGTTVNPSQGFADASDTASNGVRIFKSYPKFTYIGLTTDERKLTPPSMIAKPLYKFSVQAVGGDVAIYKFTFTVGSSTRTATGTNYNLRSYTDAAFSNADTSFNSANPGRLNNLFCANGGSTAASNLDGLHIAGAAGRRLLLETYMQRDAAACGTATTTYTIANGTTRYLLLTADITSIEEVSGVQENVTVALEGDAAYMAISASGVTVGGGRNSLMHASDIVDTDTNNDFIWSPISTTSAVTINDLDYSNAYLLPGIPTDNMVTETLSSPN